MLNAMGCDLIKKEDEDLLRITKGAMMAGIKMATEGNYIQDISKAIEEYIKKEGKKIIKMYIFLMNELNYEIKNSADSRKHVFRTLICAEIGSRAWCYYGYFG